MICIKWVEKKLGNFEEVIIVPISDVHNGDRAFDRKLLLKLILDINNTPNMFAFLDGDLCNNATKNSKSDTYKDDKSPQEQKYDIIEMLSLIQGKLLGATGGNHEERSQRESGLDISEDIAQALKIPYHPEGILYSLKVGKTFQGGQFNYTMYTTHGSGGGGTKGAKANKLHSLKNICLSDLYVMGHVHDIITLHDLYFIPDLRHNKMLKMVRKYVTAGCYLDWGGYAERGIISPNPTGFPLIRLDGTKKQIKLIV